MKIHSWQLGLAVVLAQACAGKPDVGLEIQLDKGLVGDVVWFEIGAFRGASCVAVSPMLADGIPQTATARVAFRRDAAATPRFGDLDRGTYAFAAVARGEDCGVLATACSEVDVGDAKSVSLSMRATDSPSGACGKGAVCSAARCVPASDNQDPSVGTQCSLELLGAGPLALPIGTGASLSAPAIATTPSGFVIAYKEIDSSGATARITVLPIDPAGGALSPGTAALKGRCAGAEETDGVGLSLNGADGKIILARSACGSKPALEVLSFTTTPEVTINPTFAASESSTAQRFALSNAHVSAARSGSNVVVYTEDGAAHIAAIQAGVGADVKGAGSFGGTVGMTGAWVATSDKVLALLAAGPPQDAPVLDAGLDGASEGGGGGGGGGGDQTPTLSLVMVPPGTAASAFDAAANLPRAPLTFPGLWGAVAALGSRVIVVSDGGGPRSVSYRAFDLDRASTAESNGFSVEGGGVVATADVTMIDDRAYFAALKPGGVSLHVFANASTTPRPLREIAFAREPRIPSVAGVRDTGRVAVAATSSRVAVAWTTAKTLTNNDSTGGYAVFACTP
ncbi:MAG TPA: hypothetical protein VLT33_41740 [Labilithrix sp.]|nr:hypothetical protein [Labilithrix sp.]